MQKIGKNKSLWLLTALLALAAAAGGVAYQDIYSKVISPERLPWTISQDLMTIVASIVLPALIVPDKAPALQM